MKNGLQSHLLKINSDITNGGKIKIGSALKMKRIPDEIIRKAFESINDEEYINLLKNIIDRHKRTVKAKNQFDLKGKLLRHCLGKGLRAIWFMICLMIWKNEDF